MATLEPNSSLSVDQSATTKMSKAYDLAEEGSKQGQTKMKEAYKLAGEAASDMIDNVKDQARAKYDENKVKATELSEKAGGIIREQPLVSIGVAFAAGLILAKLYK